MGRQESQGNSEWHKSHERRKLNPTVVEGSPCSSFHAPSFFTNPTCLTWILTRFLREWVSSSKVIRIAKILRQYNTARDMSHGHGIMSSDRGIQTWWPWRPSKGTKTWTLTPLEQGPLSKIWPDLTSQWMIPFLNVGSGSYVCCLVLYNCKILDKNQIFLNLHRHGPFCDSDNLKRKYHDYTVLLVAM